jgi:hypothetical protein
MAKARLMVQEPETLLTASPKPKDEGTVHIVTKVSTTIKVGGNEQKLTQPEDGIIGFMIVFDDYEKALKWVNGDASLIMTGVRQ